jgi:heterodisulfide reductase subunit A
MEKPRIGVYVCWCGNNIAKMVDVEGVAAEMMNIPNVVISKTYKYMCSDPGQDLIIKDIKENRLNRVVVSACSPRIHELTFRKALTKAGLNPYMLQMANIREHVSWVHTDKAEATSKSKALVAAAINRINFHVPLDERSVTIHPATLVIGGGITGITAALEIADAGKKVYLVENTDKLGGHAANVDLTFPYFTSVSQFMNPLIKRVHNHKNIDVFLNTEVKEISGYIGNFETMISYKDIERKIDFGNIIIASGLKAYDPSAIENYGYGIFPDVITSTEFEAMLKSGIILKKNGETPENIAIIHCVGSRNSNYHKYCSRVCCTVALKFANQLRSALPDSNIYELYSDMRSMSKGCEEMYTASSRRRIMFMMFDQKNGMPEIKNADKGDCCDMYVDVDELLSGESVRVPADMVILMTAMEGQDNARTTGQMAGISLDANRFYIEKHPKLDPVATTTNGVFIAGSCNSPKDFADCVSQARAASARVLSLISRGTVNIAVATAYINGVLCSGCKMCISVCPYTAIGFDEKKNVSVINDVLCQGCGTCVALCRSKAIDLNGCSTKQILSELSELLLKE